MKTILLTIDERLAILNALPEPNGIIQSAVIYSITNKARFTSEEIDYSGMADTADGVTWDQDKPIMKRVTFDNCEVALLDIHLPQQFGAIREKITMD